MYGARCSPIVRTGDMCSARARCPARNARRAQHAAPCTRSRCRRAIATGVDAKKKTRNYMSQVYGMGRATEDEMRRNEDENEHQRMGRRPATEASESVLNMKSNAKFILHSGSFLRSFSLTCFRSIFLAVPNRCDRIFSLFFSIRSHHFFASSL